MSDFSLRVSWTTLAPDGDFLTVADLDMGKSIDQLVYLGRAASGEAVKIWDAWFGPAAEQPMKRTFRITREY